MKSDLVKRTPTNKSQERYFIECDCASPDCMLCIDFDSLPHPAPLLVDFYFTTAPTYSFFDKIKKITKFLFSPNETVFIRSGEIVLTERNANQFLEVARHIEKCMVERDKKDKEETKGRKKVLWKKK